MSAGLRPTPVDASDYPLIKHLAGSNGHVLGNLVPYPAVFDVAWASGLGPLFSTTSRHVAGQHVTM